MKACILNYPQKQPSLWSNSTFPPSIDPKDAAVHAASLSPITSFPGPASPFGKYCLFLGYICIVTAFQAALARKTWDRSWHS